MNWDDIRGQAAATRLLKGALASGRVAHAYLFTGPRGVGKTTVARIFAAGLVCEGPDGSVRPCGRCGACDDALAFRHPDVVRLEPDGDVIRIEQIRALKRRAGLKPSRGRRQVFLVEPAEAAGEAAQNALLKVLEEPLGPSVFVLIAHQETFLLPTVVSRCVHVRFQRLSREAAAAILRERLGYGDAAELAAALGNGSISQATRFPPEDLRERRSAAVALLERLWASDPGAALEEARNWYERRDELMETLEFVQLWLRDLLICRTRPKSAAEPGRWLINFDRAADISARAERVSGEALFGSLSAIREVRRQLDKNANVRHAVDVLFLELAARGRKAAGPKE
ncbi:MAG: DNA polymerase III subunit delta' [Firmicutes bacterium]|nr:DNA polymerase III subunit delta' [Bacillota bacterium]